MLIGSPSLMKYAWPGAEPPSTKCSAAKMNPCTRLWTYELSSLASLLPTRTLTCPAITFSNSLRNMV